MLNRLCALLCCILCLFGLSGVASAEGTSKDVMTITLSSSENIRLSEDDDLLRVLAEKFNVVLEYQRVKEESSSHTYRLMASAGTLPDVMLYDSSWDFNYFIQTKAIRPLPSDLSRYPNLRALIAYPFAAAFQYDGRLWGLPRDVYREGRSTNGYCILVHKEVLDAVGMETPKTLSDWYDFLHAVKKTFPDVIPLTAATPAAMYYLTYYCAPATHTWVWQDGRYVPGFYTQAFRQNIEALRPFWDEGLLDPNYMNTGSGEPSGEDRFLMKNAAAMIVKISPHEWMSGLIPSWENLYPDLPITDELEAFFLPPAVDGRYQEAYTLDMSAVYFSANVSDEKMERILSLLNYLCSEEGKTLRRYGLQGIDWQMNPEGSPERIPDENGESRSLYRRYASYTLLRVLPTLDAEFIWDDETLDPFVRKVTSAYRQWRAETNIEVIYTASIRANLALPTAGIFFHPDIPEMAFRMLCAPEGTAACFDEICREFVEQGIDLLIDKVFYYLM